MGYFKEQKVERIALPTNPEYWVDVVDDLKYGDIKKWMNVDTTGKPEFTTTGDRFLISVIKAWNLDDEQGNILPITLESINQLEQDDVLEIIERAGGDIETDDVKKNSSEK